MTAVEVVRIEAGGLIRLPLDLLESVGFEPGEEVEVRSEAGKLVLKKKKSIVERIAGCLAVDQELAIEIIESPELEYEAF
jgi:antitoxin component of MazEF toxin-antitoxin module